MGSIDKISRIYKSELSGENYFQSVLEQAYALKMLSDTDIERIQFDCLAILAKQCEQYNGGDSSSIRVEAAQNIMTSNFFTIGLWLKTYSNPDDAVTAVQSERITELYQNGRRRIDLLIKSTKTVHSLIISDLVDISNVFYRSTIVDAIKGFFKLYSPDFGAHEIHITADYPVFNSLEKLAGIEFIQKYLEAIYYENKFLSNFPLDSIHHLLCGYDKKYQELLFNVYEPILTASIGCILTKSDVRKLNMTSSGIALLYRLFMGKTKPEIETIVLTALEELMHTFSLSNGLEEYIKRSLPLISATIENSVHSHNLEKVFIIPQYPENDPKIYFSFGEKMRDEEYRKIIKEILQCRFITDKIEIIKSSIHTLADLDDILLDAEFTADEMRAVLHELNPVEIAALSKRHQLFSNVSAFEFDERERTISECLHDYIVTLPEKQQEWIKEAANMLDEQ